MIELTEQNNVFRFNGRLVALAEGTFEPLPIDPDDPDYPAAVAALEAVIAGVLVEADNPPLLSLADLKRDAIDAAGREQQRRIALGLRVTVGPTEVVLSSDQAQRERITLIAAALANGKTYPVAGVRLYRLDGTEVSAATVAHFRAVILGLEDRLSALAEYYGDLVQTIRAAADAEALVAIDVTAGWPAV